MKGSVRPVFSLFASPHCCVKITESPVADFFPLRKSLTSIVAGSVALSELSASGLSEEACLFVFFPPLLLWAVFEYCLLFGPESCASSCFTRFFFRVLLLFLSGLSLGDFFPPFFFFRNRAGDLTRFSDGFSVVLLGRVFSSQPLTGRRLFEATVGFISFFSFPV